MKKIFTVLFCFSQLISCTYAQTISVSELILCKEIKTNERTIINDDFSRPVPVSRAGIAQSCIQSGTHWTAPYVVNTGNAATDYVSCDSLYEVVTGDSGFTHIMEVRDVEDATVSIYTYLDSVAYPVINSHHYIWRYRKVCATGDTSFFSGSYSGQMVCVPTVTCQPLDSVVLTTLFYNMAQFTLYSVAPDDMVEIRYGITAAAVDLNALSAPGVDIFPLTPLFANTTYYWTAQRDCANGMFSPLISGNFTTPNAPFSTLNNINAWPNPTSGGWLYISFESTVTGTANLTLTHLITGNIIGLSTMNVTPGTYTTQMTTLMRPPGVYDMKIELNSVEVHRMIVIQ